MRPAVAGDREFIVGIVPRLRAFGPGPLRPADAMDRAERQGLERALAAQSSSALLLIAELDDSAPAGIAYALTVTDYFTGESHGHLSIIAVAAAAEGRGVGRALLAAVERWSVSEGHRFLTLNVFAENARAIDVYERAGYAPDTIRYLKQHGP